MMLEMIITIVSSSTISSVVIALINRKGTKIKNLGDKDSVLMKRIEFLDERVTKLEKLSCYDLDCQKRI